MLRLQTLTGFFDSSLLPEPANHDPAKRANSGPSSHATGWATGSARSAARNADGPDFALPSTTTSTAALSLGPLGDRSCNSVWPQTSSAYTRLAAWRCGFDLPLKRTRNFGSRD